MERLSALTANTHSLWLRMVANPFDAQVPLLTTWYCRNWYGLGVTGMLQHALGFPSQNEQQSQLVLQHQSSNPQWHPNERVTRVLLLTAQHVPAPELQPSRQQLQS
jgi:hypothetical protein